MIANLLWQSFVVFSFLGTAPAEDSAFSELRTFQQNSQDLIVRTRVRFEEGGADEFGLGLVYFRKGTECKAVFPSQHFRRGKEKIKESRYKVENAVRGSLGEVLDRGTETISLARCKILHGFPKNLAVRRKIDLRELKPGDSASLVSLGSRTFTGDLVLESATVKGISKNWIALQSSSNVEGAIVLTASGNLLGIVLRREDEIHYALSVGRIAHWLKEQQERCQWEVIDGRDREAPNGGGKRQNDRSLWDEIVDLRKIVVGGNDDSDAPEPPKPKDPPHPNGQGNNKSSSEGESNDNRSEANVLAGSISGEIGHDSDLADWFRYEVLEDGIFWATLENASQANGQNFRLDIENSKLPSCKTKCYAKSGQTKETDKLVVSKGHTLFIKLSADRDGHAGPYLLDYTFEAERIPDKNEPDNGTASASELGLSSQIEATVGYGQDTVDFYRLGSAESGVIKVTLTNLNPGKTPIYNGRINRVALFEVASETREIQKTTIKPGGSESLILDIAGGVTYYLQVKAGSGQAAPYRLDIEFSPRN